MALVVAAPGHTLARPVPAAPSAEQAPAVRPAAARPLPAVPLRTQDRWIVGADGKRVKLASVNWFGAESPEFVVGGLARAALPSIVRWVREEGFNSIRLPWSNQLVETNPLVQDKYLTANPQLLGKRALEILDDVVAAAAAEGLMIVLDNHRGRADWCCDEAHGDGLWYSKEYPESSWIADWKTMVRRYRGQPAVVAAELRNEIRPDPAVASAPPTWGGADPRVNWKRAAQLGGEAVLAENPNLLVIVGGISYQGDLRGAYDDPVRLSIPDRVVYAPHDYHWFHTDSQQQNYAAFQQSLDDSWGKLLTPGHQRPGVPLYLSEFGSCAKGKCTAAELRYVPLITQYLLETDADWAYWTLNGTQSDGYGRQHGVIETFGLMDEAWQRTGSTFMLSFLGLVQRPRQGPGLTGAPV